MTEISEGSFSLNFGLIKLGGKLSEQDRQCAWQLYSEIVTRVAVSGKRRDRTCTDFSGEIIVESLSSLYAFFQEARQIMKNFPVGKLKEEDQSHLGILIHVLLTDVLRPFLELWQADFRAWWEQQDSRKVSWFELQKQYPKYKELLNDWTNLRKLMRQLEYTLSDEYKLQRID